MTCDGDVHRCPDCGTPGARVNDFDLSVFFCRTCDDWWREPLGI